MAMLTTTFGIGILGRRCFTTILCQFRRRLALSIHRFIIVVMMAVMAAMMVSMVMPAFLGYGQRVDDPAAEYEQHQDYRSQDHLPLRTGEVEEARLRRKRVYPLHRSRLE
jgi:hypothetical protein